MPIIVNNIQRGTLAFKGKGVSRVFKGANCVYQKQSGPATTLLNGLLACWEFNETSGTTAYDSHSIYDLVNNNATINQTGIVGTSYNFNGTDSQLSLNPVTGDLLFSTNDLTFSFWLKTDVNSSIVSIYQSSKETTPAPGCAIRLWNNGTLQFIAGNNLNNYGPRSYRYSNIRVDDNCFHHVCIIWNNADGSINFYVDGVNADGAYGEQTGQLNDISNHYEPMYIGSNPLSWYYKGYLDQFSIWRRNLTEQEILILYNSGNGRAYSEF